MPTSVPKADPNNRQFVYQRFNNGILLLRTRARVQLKPCHSEIT